MVHIDETLFDAGLIRSSSALRLQTLYDQRVEQLMEGGRNRIAEVAKFFVVQPGDTEQAMIAELGFSVLTNFIDGVRYGDVDFEPSWEWIVRHEGWFELVFILSDDGFAWIVFVEDNDDNDPTFLALCRQYAPIA